MARYKWLPVIQEELCTACNACVEACGPKCLEIGNESYAVLTNPDICGSEEHCIAPCPEECIQMQWVECEGNTARGKWKFEDA
ncbi:MAG: hypothetical protein PHP42_01780 [Bacteroidota bacterium]|nr:hypothetical protein [Bacteroidota bacterium]